MTEYKWFWAWDFDKEERWLDEMAADGWALAEAGWCRFVFERCEPGEYYVRLEMRPYDEDYISFMEETGAEYIGRCFQWQYFRKRSEFGRFDLFSDLDSRISHCGRIHRQLLAIGGANLAIGTANLILGIHSAMNSMTAILNLFVATLLMYGVGRMKGKMEYLENERKLRE